MKNKIFLGALLSAVALSSYALGQQNAQPDDVKQFEVDVRNAQSDLSLGEWPKTEKGAQSMADLAKKAAGNDAYTRAVVKQAFAYHYGSTPANGQMRLQALQIAQNQRIIELLEQQAKK